MNLYCIGYNDDDVFIYDLSLNDRFEVEAGRILNFTDELYESFDNYLDDAITVNEFLDDVSAVHGVRPSLVMPSDSIENICKDLPEDIKNEVLASVISVGKAHSPSTYIPIEHCKYVI